MQRAVNQVMAETEMTKLMAIDNTIYLKQLSVRNLPATQLPENHDFRRHFDNTSKRIIVTEPYPRLPSNVTMEDLFEDMCSHIDDACYEGLSEDVKQAFRAFRKNKRQSSKYKKYLWDNLPPNVRNDFLLKKKEFAEAEESWKATYGVPITRLPQAKVLPSENPYKAMMEFDRFRREIMNMLYNIQSGSPTAVLVYRKLDAHDLGFEYDECMRTSASHGAGPALPDPAREKRCADSAKSGEKRCADSVEEAQEGHKFHEIIGDGGAIMKRSKAIYDFSTDAMTERQSGKRYTQMTNEDGVVMFRTKREIIGEGGAILRRSNAISCFPEETTNEDSEVDSRVSERSSWSLLTQADKLAMVQLGELPESQDDGMAEYDAILNEAGREEAERDAFERRIKRSRQENYDYCLHNIDGSSLTAIMEHDWYLESLQKDFDEKTNKTTRSARGDGL